MKKIYFVYFALSVLPWTTTPANSNATTVQPVEKKTPNVLVIKTTELNERLKQIANEKK